VVTTSGPGTGRKVNKEKLKKIREVIDPNKYLALASGVALDNINENLPYCDFFVVASSVETESMSGILVPEKVKQLAEAIHYP